MSGAKAGGVLADVPEVQLINWMVKLFRSGCCRMLYRLQSEQVLECMKCAQSCLQAGVHLLAAGPERWQKVLTYVEGQMKKAETIPISEVPTDVFQEVTAKAGAQNVYAACIVRPALILKPQFGSSHSKCNPPAELELKMYEGHMAVTPRQEVESFSWDTSKEDAQADRYMPYLNQLMGSQDRSGAMEACIKA